MFWLYIDTHERGIIRAGKLSELKSQIKTLQVTPGALVPTLKKQFTRQDLALSEGICVVRGPGPFSSIRAGVLVANLLARLLKKRLYAIKANAFTEWDQIISAIKNKRIEPVTYADPIYDAEPNITVK